MTRVYWDAHALRTLRALYPFLTAGELAPILGHPAGAIYNKAIALRLGKHPEFHTRMRQALRQHALTNAALISGRFCKGHVPATKGKPMPEHVRARVAATMFKAGSLNGRAAQLIKPLGALRIDPKTQLLQRKFTTAGHGGQRWRGVHRLVWEAAHGPTPAGHIVIFKPGMRTLVEAEITLDRLELVTLAENMARNTIHRLPPELKQLTQLRGALNRQITRMEGKRNAVLAPPKPPADAAPAAAAAVDAAPDNTITGLRAELFGALRDLRAGKLDVEKARAVSDLAQTMINSAKVEVDYAKAVGADAENPFLAPAQLPAPAGTRRITHR